MMFNDYVNRTRYETTFERINSLTLSSNTSRVTVSLSVVVWYLRKYPALGS